MSGRGRGGRGGRGGGRQGGRGGRGGGGDQGGRGGGFGRGGRDGGRGGFGRGGRDGGGRGGRGGGRGGRGDPLPDLSGLKSCLTNIILANVDENFSFYLYSLESSNANSEPIDSRHRRGFLFDMGMWDGLLKTMNKKEREDLKRVVFFNGSFCFSARPIPGLEVDKLPVTLPMSSEAEGDSMVVKLVCQYTSPVELKVKAAEVGLGEVSFDKRCAGCTRAFADVGALIQHCNETGHSPVFDPEDNTAGTKPIPATVELFTAFVNSALQRALVEGGRLARWGREFIDPSEWKEPEDYKGNKLGVRIFKAFSCQFGLIRAGTGTGKAFLALTVDLRAKVIRTASLLDKLSDGNPTQYRPNKREQEQAKRTWKGETIISMIDKKTYSIDDLLFEESANTLMIENLGISHAQYFEKKGTKLKYPNAKPMVAVPGRRNEMIFFPPEIIAGNDLEVRVKEQLPQIASYGPKDRNEAFDKISKFLKPGAHTTKGASGMLPALGIKLNEGRLNATAEVMKAPMMEAAGLKIPASKGEFWAPLLGKADFKINPKVATTLNVILIHHQNIQNPSSVYGKIRNFVNGHNAKFRLAEKPTSIVKAGDSQHHWGAVERTFSSKIPPNTFVIDFCKPRKGLDPAYPVVKKILTTNGFVSQFVNFATQDHCNFRKDNDSRKSTMILQGVARQVLQKMGVRIWWVDIPRSLPMPAVFVGVDVYHAPRAYDPVKKARTAKNSVAAIIVQVLRSAKDKDNVEVFTQTDSRVAGKEYALGNALKSTVTAAMRELKVIPKSCIVWRDGIGESAFDKEASEEIEAIREGLNGGAIGKTAKRNVPLSYVVCQKRIATKLLVRQIPNVPDGAFGAPSGTLVKGIQGLQHHTFYLNGRAPPYSTAKPVRFIVVAKDTELKDVPMEELTWIMCHDYPNWAGPIKVPSVCQMAHKLAELGGGFTDAGRSIHTLKLKNTLHFL